MRTVTADQFAVDLDDILVGVQPGHSYRITRNEVAVAVLQPIASPESTVSASTASASTDARTSHAKKRGDVRLADVVNPSGTSTDEIMAILEELRADRV
jgi:antitoxin (DNA-binding transcriptional repressor) of toxin-antitoxin stability system